MDEKPEQKETKQLTGDEKPAGRENSKKQDHRQRVEALVEIWPGGWPDRPALIHRLIDCKIGRGTPLGYNERPSLTGI